MNGYHCYVLNKDGRISSRHDIETESDADALLKAQTVATLSEDFPEIEIWCGTRIVGRLPREP